MERPLPFDILKAKSLFDQVKLGNQSPADLVSAARRLHRIAYSLSQDSGRRIGASPDPDIVFDTNLINQNKIFTVDFWKETKIWMDELNLPEDIRKAILLVLPNYEYTESLRPWFTDRKDVMTGIMVLARDVLFQADRPDSPFVKANDRRDFLFHFVNYLIQFQAGIYYDDPNWKESRKFRREKTSEELKSGKRFLTYFMKLPAAGHP